MADCFIIIDGHSQIYRACFARGLNLYSPGGIEKTTGPFVFTKSLIKLVREKKPDFMAVARDGPRSDLVRKHLFPEYKEGRGGAPDEIRAQVSRCYEIIEALGIPVVDAKGWEADDVIASFVEQYVSDEVHGLVVTGDKDLHQLISPDVRVYDPLKSETFNEENVVSKWGVTADKIVDVQTLMGDPTDNIPGVKGIGEVRAVTMINAYGTVGAVYEHRHEFSDAIRKALETADLPLLTRLVELNRDLDIDIDSEDLEFHGLNMKAARPIFEELGFTRWLKE